MDKPVKMQHVHSASGKVTQKELYSYEYDHAGRLLKTKHQLNGGTETLLASNSYDELGRLQSNQRNGQAKLKTDYTYNIRSWMKTISNPLFNETLYYQDAPSTPLAGYKANYNGNISAMSGSVTNAANQQEAPRSYCFGYDNLSRLTHAGYIEANKPTANFSTSYAYDSHGNITTLKRFGRTGVSSYSTIDDLTLSYQGNQLIKVEDAAPTFAISESTDFKNGSNQPIEYTYDKNGNLTKDLNKGISIISYNSLNLPVSLSIANNSGSATNRYTYSADGRKLKVEMKYGANQTKTTDYVGNVIYENGSLKRILVDGGYIENGKYDYYVQDHLGNNRVVAQADGSVLQSNHYYPFGLTFTENNTGDSKAQPYKYNGNEFDGERGLNVYDYSARYMDPALGRFMAVDPLAEKYYGVSSYAYCKNDPILRIDVDGKDDYVVNSIGRLFNITDPRNRGKSQTDNLFNIDKSKSITVHDTGLLKSMFKQQQDLKKSIPCYGVTSNIKDAASVFKFAADNTKVEWSLNLFEKEKKIIAAVATNGQEYQVQNGDAVQEKANISGDKIIEIHSHPSETGTKGGSEQDMKLANANKSAVYFKANQTLYDYNNKKSHLNTTKIKILDDFYKYLGL